MEVDMQLADLLTPERIVVPLRARSLKEALGHLVQRLEESGAVGRAAEVEELLEGLVSGERGERIRAGEEILILAARTEGVEDLSVAMGVAVERLSEAQEAGDAEDAAPGPRAVILLLTPRRLSTLKAQVLPALVRVLRDPKRGQRLLAAGTASEVRSFQELMAVELHERLLVEDALTPLTYRVYPETPVAEIVDLMVRRGLRAVPVVGEKYEVLGIVTSGDALRQLLPRRMSGEGDPEVRPEEKPATAREIMTRSVLCVSEDQSLMEAANMMVNREVDQLPVVREGELIGFVTRDTILARLHGG